MKSIFNEKGPKPVGPYSQAVISGNLIFISGTLPINPETGEIELDDIEKQTKRVMENIKIILEGEKIGFGNVIKSTIFIKNMKDFAKINGVYSEYFTEPYPARSVVEVSNLPKNSDIEMEIIAQYENK